MQATQCILELEASLQDDVELTAQFITNATLASTLPAVVAHLSQALKLAACAGADGSAGGLPDCLRFTALA